MQINRTIRTLNRSNPITESETRRLVAAYLARGCVVSVYPAGKRRFPVGSFDSVSGNFSLATRCHLITPIATRGYNAKTS